MTPLAQREHVNQSIQTNHNTRPKLDNNFELKTEITNKTTHQIT